MDVKTVCLGMLCDGEASGYDLKKQFESTFGHFFAAGYGSIYPALSSLAKDGLVDCEEIAQDGKPDRKVYQITAAGREALLKGLANPKPSHKIRSEFLAMMCFAHYMSDEQINTVLDNRLHDIDEYEKIFSQIECDCPENWTPGMQFVLGFGQMITAAMRDYVEKHRHELVNNEVTSKKLAAG